MWERKTREQKSQSSTGSGLHNGNGKNGIHVLYCIYFGRFSSLLGRCADNVQQLRRMDRFPNVFIYTMQIVYTTVKDILPYIYSFEILCDVVQFVKDVENSPGYSELQACGKNPTVHHNKPTFDIIDELNQVNIQL